MSANKIAPNLPTSVEIVKTLLATRGRLRTQQLYSLGLIGWPSDTVTNPLPPQPLHVLDAKGEIRMRRAYNVRGGMAPFRPMPTAPYPDHPFQSVKYFKSHILGMLEERDLIRKIEYRNPEMTPVEKAEAYAKANKMTRRRQRALGETLDVGLGKGFRLKKAERKIWEAQVYSLEVDKVEPESFVKEWVWELCGLGEEREEKVMMEAGLKGVTKTHITNSKTGQKMASLIDRHEAIPSDRDIPPPPGLLSTSDLESTLSDPEAVPAQLRPDLKIDPPLPLAKPSADPLVQISSLILSDRTIANRWILASEAERTYNKAVEFGAEEKKLQRAARKDMNKTIKENRRRDKEEAFRRELQDRPDLRQRVEQVYGSGGGGFWGGSEKSTMTSGRSTMVR